MAMSRYGKLKDYLDASKDVSLDLTFQQIEQILGRPLPPSARSHRAWWSNNGDNNVMTRAWLAAGYETENVDMVNETLTFAYRAKPQAQKMRVDTSLKVEDWASPGFVYQTMKKHTQLQLSPKAQEWLNMMRPDEGDREKFVIDSIEAMVAKAKRKAVIEKYSGLKIGAGSDSVDLIREDRDGR